MRLVKLCFVSGAFLISACSTDSPNAEQSTETPASQVAQESKVDQLPSMAIIKVPVDANGQELHDSAEMRLVNGETAVNEATIASTFEKAEAPKVVFEELDAASSTESCGWLGWRRAARRNACVTPCVTQCAPRCDNTAWTGWTFFRPTYLSAGQSFGYGYGGSFPAAGGGCGQGPCGGVATPFGQGVGQNNYYYYNRAAGQIGQPWNQATPYQGGYPGAGF
jgi:hypothetical protein